MGTGGIVPGAILLATGYLGKSAKKKRPRFSENLPCPFFLGYLDGRPGARTLNHQIKSVS
ncbi:MAG TPA: hypothetical protein DDW51_16630 [Cyanobacteria bacterium UBA11367]|nr:hypothetical protein [Cyanobacteria bacterium UBA11367]